MDLPLTLEKIIVERRTHAMYVNDPQPTRAEDVLLGDLNAEYARPEDRTDEAVRLDHVRMPVPAGIPDLGNPIADMTAAGVGASIQIERITEPMQDAADDSLLDQRWDRAQSDDLSPQRGVGCSHPPRVTFDITEGRDIDRCDDEPAVKRGVLLSLRDGVGLVSASAAQLQVPALEILLEVAVVTGNDDWPPPNAHLNITEFGPGCGEMS